MLERGRRGISLNTEDLVEYRLPTFPTCEFVNLEH